MKMRAAEFGVIGAGMRDLAAGGVAGVERVLNEDSETGALPGTELLEAMGKFNDELTKAGILRDAAGLKPSSRGKRVAFDGSNRTVLNGPFAATQELVAGFWLWHVKDMDEAVAWTKRCPNPMPGPSEIELRPLYEMEDFA